MPTGMVETTVLVSSDMTETVLDGDRRGSRRGDEDLALVGIIDHPFGCAYSCHGRHYRIRRSRYHRDGVRTFIADEHLSLGRIEGYAYGAALHRNARDDGIVGV